MQTELQLEQGNVEQAWVFVVVVQCCLLAGEFGFAIIYSHGALSFNFLLDQNPSHSKHPKNDGGTAI